MSNDQANDLREALENAAIYDLRDNTNYEPTRRTNQAIRNAVRIALPILERDDRLRNAIAKIVMAEFGFVVLSKRYHVADQVLAALVADMEKVE